MSRASQAIAAALMVAVGLTGVAISASPRAPACNLEARP